MPVFERGWVVVFLAWGPVVVIWCQHTSISMTQSTDVNNLLSNNVSAIGGVNYGFTDKQASFQQADSSHGSTSTTQTGFKKLRSRRERLIEGRVFFVWINVVCSLMAVFFRPAGGVKLWLTLLVWYLYNHVGVLVGFHRYFAHRSFQATRPLQFVLAVLGSLSGQSGPIWWAVTHRNHHRTCETDKDVHSPVIHSFWHAQGGFMWNEGPDSHDELDYANNAPFFYKFRDIRIINTLAPAIHFGAAIAWAVFYGLGHAAWYHMLPCFFAWNNTQLVNSLLHVSGDEQYRDMMSPPCRAKNHKWSWPILLGENWHNNHHAVPFSASNNLHPQGFHLDPNFWCIRFFQILGLAHNVRVARPSQLKPLQKAQIVTTSDSKHFSAKSIKKRRRRKHLEKASTPQ